MFMSIDRDTEGASVSLGAPKHEESPEMSIIRKGGAALLVSAAATLAVSAPAFAHDCFNPQKDAHAPTAGVNYELTGFDANGNPVLVQIGPGQGYGGFAEIAPYTFGPEQSMPLYTHTLGSGNNPAGIVGGPGSQTAKHACDGKGIDYIDACFGAG